MYRRQKTVVLRNTVRSSTNNSDDKQNTPNNKDRVYHARRAHRKSRFGCLNCKRRRVKCFETKPHCEQCQKHGIECDYNNNTNTSSAVQLHHHSIQKKTTTTTNNTKGIISQLVERFPHLIAPDSSAYSMSLLAVTEKIEQLLQINPSTGRGRRKGTVSDGVLVLHHFHDTTASTVVPKGFQGVMRQKMIQLAFHTPYLMHTLIAVTTTHLCRIVPDNTRYKLAESYHWQEAITQYSNEVNSVIGLHNMDGLFSACLLMTVHSFTLEEYNPRDSWVFSDDPQALNWLMLQGGLRYLLYRTQPWLERSMWWDTRENIPFEDHRSGRVGLHPELADVCGIDDSTTEETNPYLWPLRMLSLLLMLERTILNFPKYTTFMGRLLPEYFDQLLKKDPPALIVLSWWLALICSVKLWWMDARVRSECVAICMFLENNCEDSRILKLLEFPAEQCGYSLRHVQEQASFESHVDVIGIS